MNFVLHAVGLCSTSLFAPLLIALPSPLPNALPTVQTTFTRTSGHCLGAFVAVNFISVSSS
jgi:hypothetical protein